jgi:cysteine synthase A
VRLRVANNILELIGSTPVVRLNKMVGRDDAIVWAKLGFFNPSASIKDRISLAMIEAAERDGIIKPGATIVEPTSGNTGIGLAMVAAVKNYKLILTMPDSVSLERRRLLKAFGVEMILTPGAEGMEGATRRAERLISQNPDYFMPQQFNNPANPEIHRKTTAQEVLKQVGKDIDAFVCGVGTGGTITGVGEVLKEHNPRVIIIAVEPASSPVISGGRAGQHEIQGIGAGFIPGVLNRSILDEVIKVSDEEAAVTARRLAREEGLFVGISSGAATFAALKVARRLKRGKKILVILPDTGARYLSTGLFEHTGH